MNITLSPNGVPIIDLELGDLAGPQPAAFTAAVDQLAESATAHSFNRVGHPTSIESRCSCGDSFESEGRDGAARASVMTWELQHCHAHAPSGVSSQAGLASLRGGA